MSTLDELLQKNAWVEAEALATKLLQANAGDHAARLALSQLQAATGRFDEASRTLAQVPEETDRYARGLLHAVLVAQRGELESAETKFRALGKLAPDRPEAFVALGRLAARRGDFGLAERAFHKAVNVAPDQWQAQLFLAGALASNQKLAEALEALHVAKQLNPVEPRVTLALAAALIELHEPAQAETILRSNLQVLPDEPRLLAALSNALVALGQVEAALEVSVQASKHSTSAALVTDQARLLLAQGFGSQAAKLCEDLDRQGLADARTLTLLALAYEAQPKPALEKAEQAYRRAMALDANDPAPATNLGLMLLGAGAVGAAKVALDEAVRRDPTCAASHLNVALALLTSGDRARARASATEALSLAQGEWVDQAQKFLASLES